MSATQFLNTPVAERLVSRPHIPVKPQVEEGARSKVARRTRAKVFESAALHSVSACFIAGVVYLVASFAGSVSLVQHTVERDSVLKINAGLQSTNLGLVRSVRELKGRDYLADWADRHNMVDADKVVTSSLTGDSKESGAPQKTND